MATFEQVWRELKGEHSLVPPLMLRSWVQEAYGRACERNGFAFLRTEATLVINDARAVTMTATQGSTTVTSAALFATTDAGRQIRFSTRMIYTIAAVVDASTITLDRVYTEPAVTEDATIYDGYATLPSNFKRFLVIADLTNQRPIPFWYTEDQLAILDIAMVSNDGFVRALIPQAYSTATATLGQVRYQYWPRPTSARYYPYLYIRSVEQLTDSDVLPGVFAERVDAFKAYARYRCALWPGTVEQKNPAFQPSLAPALRQEWEEELQYLILADDNEYPQQYMPVNWGSWPMLSSATRVLRETDATLNDYW